MIWLQNMDLAILWCHGGQPTASGSCSCNIHAGAKRLTLGTTIGLLRFEVEKLDRWVLINGELRYVDQVLYDASTPLLWKCMIGLSMDKWQLSGGRRLFIRQSRILPVFVFDFNLYHVFLPLIWVFTEISCDFFLTFFVSYLDSSCTYWISK